MKQRLEIVLAVSLLAFACRGNGHLERKEQQYDVVTEGSASGVTSTINSPGENPPPVNTTPITGTSPNADTTTAFTLPTATEGNPVGPGNLAGTLPQGSTGSMRSGMPSVPSPAAPPTARTTPRVRPQRTTAPETTTQAPAPAQYPPSATTPSQPPSTTQAPPPPPVTSPPTDTNADQKNPPPAKANTKPPADNNPPPDEQKPPSPPPPATTTTPPSTDTSRR